MFRTSKKNYSYMINKHTQHAYKEYIIKNNAEWNLEIIAIKYKLKML